MKRPASLLFGWTYGMVALGASAGPVIVGAVRDSTGTYLLALSLSGGFMAAAAALSAVLAPYRFARQGATTDCAEVASLTPAR